MTTTRPADGTDGWMLVVEEDVAGLRARVTELMQAAERDRRELSAMQERVSETESLALQAAAQAAAVSGRLDELHSLRDRLARFQAAVDEQREQFDTALRQLRHELDVERDSLAQTARRLAAVEQTTAEQSGRITAFDEAVQRLGDEDAELAQRIAQTEAHADANDARIAANAEALRRTSAEQRITDTRRETDARKIDELAERVNAAHQSLLRVRETADQWDDLASAIDAMRARADDSRRMLDEAAALAASVRRSFELLEERIGDVERGAEQLRVRDTHRERALAALNDDLERLRGEMGREQQRFVALQEQIRRRQITDLEQELRELKAYLRVQVDD